MTNVLTSEGVGLDCREIRRRMKDRIGREPTVAEVATQLSLMLGGMMVALSSATEDPDKNLQEMLDTFNEQTLKIGETAKKARRKASPT